MVTTEKEYRGVNKVLYTYAEALKILYQNDDKECEGNDVEIEDLDQKAEEFFQKEGKQSSND